MQISRFYHPPSRARGLWKFFIFHPQGWKEIDISKFIANPFSGLASPASSFSPESTYKNFPNKKAPASVSPMLFWKGRDQSWNSLLQNLAPILYHKPRWHLVATFIFCQFHLQILLAAYRCHAHVNALHDQGYN